MATTTTPCLANPTPDVFCDELEPPVKPPPCIHTITGRLRAVAAAGRQTFRHRPSPEAIAAPGATAAAVGGGPTSPCIPFGPNSAAWPTPAPRAGGSGGRQRRSPPGG